jgi:hypothetical protein
LSFRRIELFRLLSSSASVVGEGVDDREKRVDRFVDC